MQCPNCLSLIPDGSETCGNCGVATGRLPAPRQSLSLKEPLHKWVLGGGIGTVIIGLLIMAAATDSVGTTIGLLVLALGSATLYFTKFGRFWENLEGTPKYVSYAGVGVGLIMAAFVVIAIVIVQFTGLGLGGDDRA